MDSPFAITVYDKGFARKGTVGAPQALTVTPRHNQQPTAQLVVPSTSPRLNDLLTAGARVVITYKGDHLLSGPVRSMQAQGPSSSASFTFQILDDWWLLNRLLAWPVPANALTAQSVEYETRTGAAETVLKAIVTANKSRSTPTVTVAADGARGASITVSNRFHPVADRTIPLVDAAGIGVTVKQVGTGITVDCYAVATYPRTLTEASGIVRDWSWSSEGPKATRVIVGGQGEGVARAFRSRTSSLLESLYGYSVEGFKDATDATTDADLDLRGDQFLVENAPTSGMAVTLSETSVFKYSPTGTGGVRVGDLVTIETAPGVTITDVLRECTLAWSVDKGLEVTPQVGDRSGDPSLTLASAVAGLARGFRTLARR